MLPFIIFKLCSTYFFFFKQKTAYEMRISDWSSDVCSSDLGSHLVIRDDGIFEGSVSGGCVEGDVIVQALELIAAGGGFRRLDYGVADAQAWEVGLACGGRISILLQTVDGAHFPPALIE